MRLLHHRSVGSRRTSFRCHGTGLRQVYATHPTLHMPATETQLSSDLLDGATNFLGRSDLLKHCLARGVAPAAHQTFMGRDRRATVRPCDHGLLWRIRIALSLKRGSPVRRFEAAEMPLDGFSEVFPPVDAVSYLPSLRFTLTRSVRIKAGAIHAHSRRRDSCQTRPERIWCDSGRRSVGRATLGCAR